jgi:hypothetical protein
MDQVSIAINAAISGRLKSFEKRLEEFSTKIAPQPQQEPQDDKKPSNAELAALKRQFDALQKERDLEVSRRKDSELRTTIKDQLQKTGVAPHLTKAAMAVLVDSDKLVGYNEDGELVFRTSTGDLTVEEGIRSWVKSEEGKSFVQPKGVSGSGERQVKSSALSTEGRKVSKEEAGEAFQRWLMGNR